MTAGIAGLAGCGAPGEQTETEANGGAAGTETDAAGATETEAGGSPAEETGTDGASPTDGGGGATTEIAMITDGSDYLFDPIGLFVEPGTTVTWINEAGSHSSTAYTQDNPQSEVRRIPEDAAGWNSDILSEGGAEFTHTFEVEGTYDYYCIPHKTLGMVGRIVVGEPGGVEGDPPDGAVPEPQRIVEEGPITQENFNP